MRRVQLDPTWPDSWRTSYAYDCVEIWGDLRHRGHTYAYDIRRRVAIDLVRKAAPAGGRVLDVAAAQGNFSLALAELGYEVVWNDLRADLAGYVQLKHEYGHLEYRPGDVFAFDDRHSYDVILITEIIEHVAHPDQFLTRVASLLNPNGHIVMTTPNGQYFRNRLPKFSECPDPSVFERVQFKPNSDGHIFLLHGDEVNMLAKRACLEVIELVYFTNPLTKGYLKLAPLLDVLPKRMVDALETRTQAMPVRLRRRLHTGMAALFGVKD
jgi:2-polyprenyl-3-methyl-5-hydroxy-6-metoxy-1,4-benzoquinol methylase